LQKLFVGCFLGVFVAASLGVAHSQSAPTAPPSGPVQSEPAASGQSSSAKKPEHRLTQQEGAQLLGESPKILEFASQDTGLPIRSRVKTRLTTRDEVEKYLNQQMKDDKDAKRMERSEIVLKKFGLLDNSFQLKPFLISLYREQVAGYYDEKTKTMNLLDWVDADDQKPVMAHELTHALQDQFINLDKWNKAGNDEDKISKNVKEDNERLAKDEIDTARDAVVEGQAMVTFFDYALKPQGQSILNAPQIVDMLKENMMDTSGSPVLARAPLLIQESMMFPYEQGLAFEADILRDKGTQQAFAGVLSEPPTTSAEIMHPMDYLFHKKQPLLPIPDLHPLLDAKYVPYDIGVVGEFDVKTLVDLFASSKESDQITSRWKGGTYYAAQRRSDLNTPKQDTPASLGLVYFSAWDTPQAATRFAELYQRQFPRKYVQLKQLEDTADDHPRLADKEKMYDTDQGFVVVAVAGKTVFISEGFTKEEARKMQLLFAASNTDGAIRASRRAPASPVDQLSDLTGGLRSLLNLDGMPKFAMCSTGQMHRHFVY
jgi:hypothetical protein